MPLGPSLLLAVFWTCIMWFLSHSGTNPGGPSWSVYWGLLSLLLEKNQLSFFNLCVGSLMEALGPLVKTSGPSPPNFYGLLQFGSNAVYFSLRLSSTGHSFLLDRSLLWPPSFLDCPHIFLGGFCLPVVSFHHLLHSSYFNQHTLFFPTISSIQSISLSNPSFNTSCQSLGLGTGFWLTTGFPEHL